MCWRSLCHHRQRSTEIAAEPEPERHVASWDREFADSPLEESGFEPLVPIATEMLIELAKGISNATRMLAVGDIGPAPRLCCL
jgi:hypothetical protein